MTEWIPYERRVGHPADFRVRYRFYAQEEGGRRTLPYQGYRADFAYAADERLILYMIHPEFEDEHGQVIGREEHVPACGTALVWIVIPERRQDIHRHRIHTGTRGYMMEGPHRTAEVEVIEILGLFTNS
ncbi:hypothetical protein [Paenibacillus bovis]|uniref:hypothetical protein n=1 Tax=Paenibacillus bovis TaxID=1616788 RepID=UPI000B076F00|nr:hypothetical protein [Paenibacillus bovis]